MGKKDKPTPFRHPNHPRPVTRRDFLAQGFIGGAGMLMAPTVLGLLVKSSIARAAGCDDGGGIMQLPAVLIIDHAGGAGLLPQTLPLSQGDQPLAVSGYRALGMPSGQDPTTASGIGDNSWGINFQKNLGFVTELNRVALPAAKAKTNSFSLLGQLSDDTSNNRINPASGLALLGLVGDSDRKIVSVAGTSSSASGGNSDVAVAAPFYRAVQIGSSSAAAGLLSLGALTTRLNNDKTLSARVLKAMQNMTAGQLQKYSEQDLPSQARDLVNCGYLKATALSSGGGSGAPSLDPASSTIVTSVFDFTNSTEQAAGTLAYLLAQGFCGVATLELGGRDYHDSTRATGEAKDTEAARITAKVLNLFSRLVSEGGARPRPLMIIHLTDGGVSTDQVADANANGFFRWTSDRGSASAAYVFGYDPAARPAVAKNQLGYAKAVDGGVDRTLATFSGNPVTFSEVLMTNWLSFAGRAPTDLTKAFTPTLTTTEMSQYSVLTRPG